MHFCWSSSAATRDHLSEIQELICESCHLARHLSGCWWYGAVEVWNLWPIGTVICKKYRWNTNSFNSSEETDHEDQVVPVYSSVLIFEKLVVLRLKPRPSQSCESFKRLRRGPRPGAGQLLNHLIHWIHDLDISDDSNLCRYTNPMCYGLFFVPQMKMNKL